MRQQATKYMKAFEIMDRMEEYGFDYIVVKYENLIDLEHPEVQINEMKRMLKYLYSDDGWEKNEEMLMKRMECLFPFLMESEYQRLGVIHRPKANETIHVTMEMAYGWLIGKYRVVFCTAWKKMKERVMVYGYDSLPEAHCGSRIERVAKD